MNMLQGWPAAIDPQEAAAALRTYLVEISGQPLGQELRRLKNTTSMLGEDVLMLLNYFAAHTSGAVLEIGTYIGGATVAMALGLPPGRKMISLEIGGTHDHDYFPSRDIFLDLQLNLLKWQVYSKVIALKSDARNPAVLRAVADEVGEQGIGLLVMDADGDVQRDLDNLMPLLSAGCIVVADDYVSNDNFHGDAAYPGYSANKDLKVKVQVDALCAAGVLEQFGVYGWGTWIGRLRSAR